MGKDKNEDKDENEDENHDKEAVDARRVVVGTRTMPRMKVGMTSYRKVDRRAWMKAPTLKEM
jgi:hypothetical protein